jgi:mannose-1-phosphate guanylyltransferase
MSNIYAVVLAGGKGERFWPQSRENKPKQLLPLTGKKSMLQETLDRVEPLTSRERQWVVTNADLIEPIKKSGVSDIKLVGEPMGRNTAPAIAVAAAEIHRQDPAAVMMVLPSDHHIVDVEMFRQVLLQGVDLAEKDFLVTIGLKPDRPETGYGYIERGEVLPNCRIPCFKVKSFREKPDAETANKFFRSGYFYWNGGIFIWKAATILEQFKTHMPKLHAQLSEWQNQGGFPAGEEKFREFYGSVEKISIDYGIMEKADKVAVIKGEFGWDDLGSWEALERFHTADDKGNIKLGLVEMQDCECNIAMCDEGLVAALGVKDLIIVKSGNAVMVCHRSKAQEVRKLLEQIRANPDLRKYL